MPTSQSASSRPPRSWAGVPADDRRAERRTLLLDAAFELLGTEGWSGTTVRAVCQQSRLNPRYFYESFDDLDALVVAVYDRIVDELGHKILAAVGAAADPPSQLRAAIETVVRFVDEDRRRARVLYVEALGNEALNRRRVETGLATVGFLETFGAEAGARPKSMEQVRSMAAAILVGGFSELLVAWIDGRIDVARERLIDDATEMFLALGNAAGTIATRRQR